MFGSIWQEISCYWLDLCNAPIIEAAVADNVVEEASGLVAFNGGGYGSGKSGKSGSYYCYSDCDCYDWQFCNFFGSSSGYSSSSSGKSARARRDIANPVDQKVARVVVIIVHPPQGLAKVVSHRSLVRVVTLTTTLMMTTTIITTNSAEVVTVAPGDTMICSDKPQV